MMTCRVLIFKSESHQAVDPYCEELCNAGFEAQTIPVIYFKFFNLDSLLQKLLLPERFSGLVLTSERCVEAVALALGNDCKNLMAKWAFNSILCTGPATRDKIKETLGLAASIGEKQRAEGIIDIFTSDKKNFDKPVLYPCGELASAKDTISSALLEHNIQCDSVVVYSTLPNPELSSTLSILLSKHEQLSSLILVFFSPSGFKTALEKLKAMPHSSTILKLSQFVSIGPTTTAAIRQQGFQVWAESALPNPHCLCETIKKAQLTN